MKRARRGGLRGETAASSVRAGNLRTIRYHWREGRTRGYAECCIAHFCWDALMGWPASVTRWRQVGRRPTGCGGPVECGVFHAGGSPYSFLDRVARIARHQAEHLPLTAPGRRRRHTAKSGSRLWRDATPEQKTLASETNRLAELYWDA